MRFIDLFAGIGGFRLGMEKAGHRCVGYIENDKYARQSYQAIHDTRGEWTANDIRAVDPWELPEADCYTAGFPCQSFSIAGKRGGFKDTRGTLFFEIMRLAEARKPKYLFLENVRGLLSHDGGKTFGTILNTLWELGYDAEWQVLNSKNHGVPQNRERVFIVGYLGGRSGRKIFPITSERRPSVEVKGQHKINQIGNLIDTDSFGGNPHRGRVYGIDGISPCLNTMGGGGLEPKIAILRPKRHHDFLIRKLTPKECWRLQGFPDWAFHRAKDAGISDTQLYRQAGNAVTVNVVYEIAKRLKEAD